MRRIWLIFALVIVLPPDIIDIAIFSFTFGRVDRHPVLKFLSIQRIILGEIEINKASQSMAIGTQPHITIFIMMAIDCLLVEPGFILLGIHIGSRHRTGVLERYTLSNQILFFGVELVDVV